MNSFNTNNKIIQIYFVFLRTMYAPSLFRFLFFLLLRLANAGLFNVCFHSNQAGERGTEVAMYDYAHYLELFYGTHYRSVILFPNLPQVTNGIGLKNFEKRFPVFFYDCSILGVPGGINLPIRAKEIGCDMLYIIKGGLKEWEPRYPESFDLKLLPVAVHAVFHYEDHGSTYASVSADIATNMGVQTYNVVPHIIRPPNASYVGTTLRSKLGIPSNTLVLCRNGGANTFDVDFVKNVIIELTAKYDNTTLQFIFIGTNPFISECDKLGDECHTDSIHFFPATTDVQVKEALFSSCDAMVHARTEGETFGIAVGEFSVRNKPVITYPGTYKNHINILGDKGFVYTNKEELIAIIDKFIREGIPDRDFNAYRPYYPEIVMKQFKSIFIDPIVVNINLNRSVNQDSLKQSTVVLEEPMEYTLNTEIRVFQRVKTKFSYEKVAKDIQTQHTLTFRRGNENIDVFADRIVENSDEICINLSKVRFYSLHVPNPSFQSCSHALVGQLVELLFPSTNTTTANMERMKLISAIEMILENRQRMVALLVPTTSKGFPANVNNVDLPIFKYFIPSFLETLKMDDMGGRGGVLPVLYFGYDIGDPVYDHPVRRNEILEAMTLLLQGVDIRPIAQEGYGNRVFHKFNELAAIAYKDGCQYFFILNDDSIFLSSDWALHAISILQNNPLLPNFGTVAFFEMSAPALRFFPSFPIFHRMHLEIFGIDSAFPQFFNNSHGDPWLSEVYVIFNSSIVPEDLRLRNAIFTGKNNSTNLAEVSSRYGDQSIVSPWDLYDRYVELVQWGRRRIANKLWGTLEWFEWNFNQLAYGPEGIYYKFMCENFMTCNIPDFFLSRESVAAFYKRTSLSRPLPYEEVTICADFPTCSQWNLFQNSPSMLAKELPDPPIESAAEMNRCNGNGEEYRHSNINVAQGERQLVQSPRQSELANICTNAAKHFRNNLGERVMLIPRPAPSETWPRLYVGFTFNDEVDMLEIHLNELRDVVDFFIIAESNQSFTGLKKSLVFNDVKDRFSSMMHKIIHVIVDDLPGGDDTWAKEIYQRRMLFTRGLHVKGKSVRVGDIVIVADADEIIRPEILQALKYCSGYDGRRINFRPNNYYYAYSFRDISFGDEFSAWTHPDATVYQGTELDAQGIRMSHYSDPTLILVDAGWHCSYCSPTLQQLRNKLQTISHIEYTHDLSLQNRSHLIHSVRNGLDLLRRPHVKFIFEEATDIPLYVREHAAKFDYLLDRRGPTALFKDY